MDLDKQRFRLGAFVLAAGTLLAVMAVFFGGSPRFLQSRVKYTIVFDVAPGVVRGTPVRKSGVRIGEVADVNLDDAKGVVRVTIAIDPKYSLRDNEEPIIVPDLLSRDTTIDFVPKIVPRTEPKLKSRAAPPEIVPTAFAQGPEPGIMPPAPPPAGQGKVLPPGAEIRGRAPPDARQLIQEATDVIPSVQTSINQISKSVARFEKLGPVLEDALREYADLGRALNEAVPEIRRTNDEIRAVVKRVRDLDPEVRRALGEIEEVARQYKRVGERVDVLLQTNQDAIDKTIKNIQTVTQRVGEFLTEDNQKNFAASLKSLQNLSKSLETLSGQAQKETLPRFQDTLAKLDAVLLNVNRTITPIADRSEQITRNLDNTLVQIARLTGSLAGIAGNAMQADGSIQRFLTDPSFFNNLNDASLMLARILPRVDRILKDIEVFADKIARDPGRIGVGGAIRPDSGLKDPPYAPVTNFKPRSP
jgi:phospholipid/cholesterol/gamma-HCH transport system substrate-binding protein